MKSIVLFFGGLVLSSMGFAQITMTSGLTADQAVQYLLGPTVVYSNASFTGSGLQLGQLDGLAASANFGIGSGIVLCTDDIQTLSPTGVIGTVTPNISVEPDLLAVAQSVPPMINQNFTITNVNNVAILEFDFVATGNNLSFNYIFGSDEYLTYVNTQYNDVFAFFLSGPGITGPYASPAAFPGGAINIAAVPNSNPPLPITISSVNNVLNNQYYIDNQTQVDISSNGYTTVLEAQSPIQCGQTYHIKLAIADCGDQSLQSFVCLEAGSFNVGTNLIQPIAVTTPGQSPIPGFPANAILEGESCYDGIFVLSPPPCSIEPDTIQILYGGSATLGSDYTAGGITEIILYPNQPDTLFLSALVDNIAEGDDSLTFANVTSGYETITLSFVFEDLINGDMDTASATLLLVDYSPVSIGEVPDYNLCSGIPVNVDGVPGSIQNGVPNYTYQWDNPSGNSISTASTITLIHGAPMPEEGDYWVTVTDFCGNKDSSQFHITIPVAPLDEPDSVITDVCEGEPLILSVLDDPSYDYSWYYTDNNNVDVPIGNNTNVLALPSLYSQSFWVVKSESVCNYEVSWYFAVNAEVCQVEIPNIFTPGEDYNPDDTDPASGDPLGNNNFYIRGLVKNDGTPRFPGSSLQVFNRWGTLVYENNNYMNEWNPKDIAEGVYYYVFKFNRTTPEFFEGYVHIVR
jgi:CHU_C Type IX secretion signal domain